MCHVQIAQNIDQFIRYETRTAGVINKTLLCYQFGYISTLKKKSTRRQAQKTHTTISKTSAEKGFHKGHPHFILDHIIKLKKLEYSTAFS